MKNSFLVLLLSLFTLASIAGGKRFTRSEYIDMWKEEAIRQMVDHKIPASITMAQAILESGDGNSELASKSNNHFGIKCHSTWKGKKVYHDDDKKGECFRHYKNAFESFDDHSDFLEKKRYESLFTYNITDYKKWAKGLKKCGYATNPKYPDLLIRIIEDYKLYELDEEGLARANGDVIAKKDKRKKDTGKASADYDTDETLPEVTLTNRRAVRISENNIKYIIGEAGDTPESIAADLDLMPWQIRKYNDFGKGHAPEEGQVIYIQPKRGKAKVHQHTVKEGETIWDISQKYGIKIKKIYKLNSMSPGTEPAPGTVLTIGRATR